MVNLARVDYREKIKGRARITPEEFTAAWNTLGNDDDIVNLMGNAGRYSNPEFLEWFYSPAAPKVAKKWHEFLVDGAARAFRKPALDVIFSRLTIAQRTSFFISQFEFLSTDEENPFAKTYEYILLHYLMDYYKLFRAIVQSGRFEVLCPTVAAAQKYGSYDNLKREISRTLK